MTDEDGGDYTYYRADVMFGYYTVQRYKTWWQWWSTGMSSEYCRDEADGKRKCWEHHKAEMCKMLNCITEEKD
jgi:hypothetical protein